MKHFLDLHATEPAALEAMLASAAAMKAARAGHAARHA